MNEYDRLTWRIELLEDHLITRTTNADVDEKQTQQNILDHIMDLKRRRQELEPYDGL